MIVHLYDQASLEERYTGLLKNVHQIHGYNLSAEIVKKVGGA